MHVDISLIASEALELLEDKGWCQFQTTDDKGRMCLGGALWRATFEDNESIQPMHSWEYGDAAVKWMNVQGAAGKVIKTLYPYRVPVYDYANIPTFNDHPDTSEEDVRMVLKTMTENDSM